MTHPAEIDRIVADIIATVERCSAGMRDALEAQRRELDRVLPFLEADVDENDIVQVWMPRGLMPDMTIGDEHHSGVRMWECVEMTSDWLVFERI